MSLLTNGWLETVFGAGVGAASGETVSGRSAAILVAILERVKCPDERSTGSASHRGYR